MSALANEPLVDPPKPVEEEECIELECRLSVGNETILVPLEGFRKAILRAIPYVESAELVEGIDYWQNRQTILLKALRGPPSLGNGIQVLDSAVAYLQDAFSRVEYVYFIQVDEVLWKIGRSCGLQRPRELAASTAGGCVRHIIATEDSAALEQLIHKRLADRRIAGSEVFRCDLNERGVYQWELLMWLQRPIVVMSVPDDE